MYPLSLAFPYDRVIHLIHNIQYHVIVRHFAEGCVAADLRWHRQTAGVFLLFPFFCFSAPRSKTKQKPTQQRTHAHTHTQLAVVLEGEV
jgi:hypothetical protein